MRPSEQEIKDFMVRLQDNGFAVAVFTPEELGTEVDIEEVEDGMIHAGWNVIGEASGKPPIFS